MRHRLEQLLEQASIQVVPPCNLPGLPELPGRVAIWGAGTLGREVRQCLADRNTHTAYFIDSDPVQFGGMVDGVEVVPPYLLCTRERLPVLVCTGRGSADCVMQLQHMGFDRYHIVAKLMQWPAFDVAAHAEDILTVYDSLQDDHSRKTYLAALRMRQEGNNAHALVSPYLQYFHPQVRIAEGDVVISGGGYTGNTVANYARATQRRCRIHCFEPSAVMYSALTRNIEEWNLSHMVTPVHQALWHCKATLHFHSPHPEQGNSSVQAYGAETVAGIDLDSYAAAAGLDCIDLLELDVEGSELSALEGARELIKHCTPKLQLSIYHKPNHLWDIALFVHSLVPEYKFWVGHHAMTYGETVLYACID